MGLLEQQASAAREILCCGKKDNSVEDSKGSNAYELESGSTGSGSHARPTSALTSNTDDNLDDLNVFIKTRNHKEIVQRLRSMQLGQLSRDPDGDSSDRTVFYSVLRHATNGDQILIQKLDECVTTTREDENDAECALQVNFNPLLEGNGGDQTDLVRDLLSLKSHDTKNVLLHPVMETFLEMKWRKVRRVFFLQFIIYCTFLLSYSLFLGNIFYRKNKRRRIKISDLVVEMDKVVFPSELKDLEAAINQEDDEENDDNSTEVGTRAFAQCLLSGVPTVTCTFEMILFATIIILFLEELMQFYALGPRQYVKEFENVLELTVLGLAAASLALQGDKKMLKWVSAVGICLAYLELIFLMGRFPVLGGNISLMFYNITRHLFRSLVNFLVLIIGFAFGFFIIHHKKSTEQFENPLKAIVKTLTMSLGEFDFDDLYAAHGKDNFSRVFTLSLLVGLAIMGTLVLVNLIVALIISDIETMKEQAHLQSLINKAQHVVSIESVLQFIFCCCTKMRNYIRVNSLVLICPHHICRCQNKMISKKIVSRLKTIVSKRRLRQRLEDLSLARITGEAGDGPVGQGQGQGQTTDIEAMAFLFKAMAKVMRQTSGKQDDGRGGARGDNVLADLAEMWLENS